MNDQASTPMLRMFDLRRHLSFAGLTIRDAIGVAVASRLHTDDVHLRSAMDWLCRAHDATGGKGMSSGYSWLDGWQDPYPETTGYVIPTFLNYARISGNQQYVERARRMADWEIEIQLATGAVRGGIGVNSYPIVFNTGQVILGWTAMYRHTSDTRYLYAARRAADWLVDIQDDDGKWSKHTFNSMPHAYHSRVAWPILEVYALTKDAKYRQAAEQHVRWVLSLANENGWFREMGFKRDELPFTHTIAYSLRGLLECARLLDGDVVKCINDAVLKACERILIRYECRKNDPRGMPHYLPGTLDENWKSADRYSCLTGNVQLAIIFLKLFQNGTLAPPPPLSGEANTSLSTGDPRFANAALKLIDQVKATQPLRALNPSVRGAVAGSYPIWGKYIRFGYPNWATKFLADAIMLSQQTLDDLRRAAT